MRIRSIRYRSTSQERPQGGPPVVPAAPAETLSEVDAARYIGMSDGWLKKSRTRRFRGVSDAPPFVRAGSRRIVYRRRDLDEWLAMRVHHVGPTPGPDIEGAEADQAAV